MSRANTNENEERVPRETSCNHFALSSFICAMGGFIFAT